MLFRNARFLKVEGIKQETFCRYPEKGISETIFAFWQAYRTYGEPKLFVPKRLYHGYERESSFFLRVLGLSKNQSLWLGIPRSFSFRSCYLRTCSVRSVYFVWDNLPPTLQSEAKSLRAAGNPCLNRRFSLGCHQWIKWSNCAGVLCSRDLVGIRDGRDGFYQRVDSRVSCVSCIDSWCREVILFAVFCVKSN